MYKYANEIGERLRNECPDNDCRIYLNVYNMERAVALDLEMCILSEHSRTILEAEHRRLQRELEKMALTNYAVREYWRANKDRPNPWRA